MRGLAVIILSVCCLGPTAVGCTATPSPNTPRGAEATATPRVRIGTEQHGQTVTARIGDVVSVKLGTSQPGWWVEFDREILQPVGSEESLRNPPPEGWLFRCIGVGTSELVLTAPATPCPAGTVCPPAQFEFHARMEVTKQTARDIR